MRSLSGPAVVLLSGVLALAMLTGCPPPEPEVAEVPPEPDEPYVQADFVVELTQPQSDDVGHYVALTEPREVVVRGFASGAQTPQVVHVNGVAAQSYQVQHAAPYGRQAGQQVVRFHAPVALRPEDRIVVTVEPYEGQEMVFQPDTDATTDRWRIRSEADPALTPQLARTHLAAGDYDAAVSPFDRSIEFEQNPWTYLYQANAFVRQERTDEALEAFERVEQTYPTMPDLYYARGLLYLDLDQYNEAIAQFQEAAELAPEWAEPHFAIGQAYREQGDYAAAAEHYLSAIEIAPDWAAPYYALAWVRLDQDATDEAVVLVREAEQRGPWRVEIHEVLAQRLWQAGAREPARRQLEIVTRLNGQRAGWWDEIEAGTPEYQPYDQWPWEERAVAGYRVTEAHPWYDPDRPQRERMTPDGPALGPDTTPPGPGAPPADVAPGARPVPGAPPTPGPGPSPGPDAPPADAAPGGDPGPGGPPGGIAPDGAPGPQTPPARGY